MSVTDFEGKKVERQAQRITWDPSSEKGGFKHFMLEEIAEQPRTVQETTLGRIFQDTGRIFLEEMHVDDAEFRALKKINIAACGTSWHAGLAGKFMIETLARVPVEVDYASEWRYRDPILDAQTITLLISQSGETADTIADQREAKNKGSKTLAICNVVGSMITREAAGTIYTHAGPEIGVASTKAFTGSSRSLFICALSGPSPGHDHRKTIRNSGTGTGANSRKAGADPDSRRGLRRVSQDLRSRAGLLIPRPRHPLPDRPRRRTQAERNFLHPRRRLSRRRNEAWPQCPDRRESSSISVHIRATGCSAQFRKKCRFRPVPKNSVMTCYRTSPK